MIDSETVRMVEPVMVPDVFALGLGDVEDVGGRCFRFTLYSRQHVRGVEEMVVVAKIILPIEAVPPALVMAAKAVGFSIVSGGYLPGRGVH